MKKIFAGLFALLTIVGAFFIASPASAGTPQSNYPYTIQTDWFASGYVDGYGPGESVPTDANSVTWSQTLYAGESCDGVIQHDTYLMTSRKDELEFGALLALGVLDKPGSGGNTDSKWIQSWYFTVLPLCDVPTTDTPTSDTPTSETPTSDTPTSDTPTSDTPTSDTPTSDTPTSDTPTSETPTSDTPTSDTPTSDTPTSDTPTSDTPTSDTPTSETTPTETTPPVKVVLTPVSPQVLPGECDPNTGVVGTPGVAVEHTDGINYTVHITKSKITVVALLVDASTTEFGPLPEGWTLQGPKAVFFVSVPEVPCTKIVTTTATPPATTVTTTILPPPVVTPPTKTVTKPPKTVTAPPLTSLIPPTSSSVPTTAPETSTSESTTSSEVVPPTTSLIPPTVTSPVGPLASTGVGSWVGPSVIIGIILLIAGGVIAVTVRKRGRHS